MVKRLKWLVLTIVKNFNFKQKNLKKTSPHDRVPQNVGQFKVSASSLCMLLRMYTFCMS